MKNCISFLFIFIFSGSLYAQDTILTFAYSNYYSVDTKTNVREPLGIFSYFNPDNFSMILDGRITRKSFDFSLGLGYINREININDLLETHDPDYGPNGSHSSVTRTTKMEYSGILGDLIINAGMELKIPLFRNKMFMGPGIQVGYDQRIFKREYVNQSTYLYKHYYYNGLTGETGGSSSSEIVPLTQDNLEIGKQSLFGGLKFSCGSNSGKYRILISFGTRRFFNSRYQYRDPYYYYRNYSKDKYIQCSVGYRI